MEAITSNMIWTHVVSLLDTIPIFIAIKIMGSEAGILKVFLVQLFLTALSFGISLFIPEGIASFILAFVILILEFILFKFVFDLSIFKVIITMVIAFALSRLWIIILLALGIGMSAAIN